MKQKTSAIPTLYEQMMGCNGRTERPYRFSRMQQNYQRHYLIACHDYAYLHRCCERLRMVTKKKGKRRFTNQQFN